MAKIKIDKEVCAMADAFAEREYEIDGYEREWLSKGYYHGFMDAKSALSIMTFEQLQSIEECLFCDNPSVSAKSIARKWFKSLN